MAIELNIGVVVLIGGLIGTLATMGVVCQLRTGELGQCDLADLLTRQIAIVQDASDEERIRQLTEKSKELNETILLLNQQLDEKRVELEKAHSDIEHSIRNARNIAQALANAADSDGEIGDQIKSYIHKQRRVNEYVIEYLCSADPAFVGTPACLDSGGS